MVENDHGPDVTARSFTPMADIEPQPGARLAMPERAVPAELASPDSAPPPAGGIDVDAAVRAALAVATAALLAIVLAKASAPTGASLPPDVARSRS